MLYQDDRTWLYAEHDERYALGDPATPLLTLNAVDAFGCAWAADTPEGSDAPEVTLPMDARQDGHGGYSGEPTYEPRALSFTGTVAAPSRDALKAAHRRYLAAVLGAVPGFQRYTDLNAGPARGLWVKPSGKPRWRALTDRAAEFAFVLIAEDPFWTGAATTYGPVRLPMVGGEGGYPMGAAGAVMPWTSTGGTAAQTVARVPNDGDEDAHAVYTVTGPIPRPRIQLGNGLFVALAADLGAFDVWTVDTAAGTSTVNGVDRYDAWGAGSVFPLIPGGTVDPATGEISGGGTEIRLRSGTGGQDQTARLEILTASTWK
jgi:hypothetical protein